MIDMGDVRRRFVQTFFEEAEDNLGVLETGLLDLSRGDGDAEALHRIFRAAHSIKGSAGLFGFDELARTMHRAEDLLDAMRSGRVPPSPERVTGLLEAVDHLRGTIAMLQDGGAPEAGADDALRARLEALLHGSAASTPPSVDVAAAPTAPDAPASELPAPAPDGASTGNATGDYDTHLRFAPDPDIFRSGNDPALPLRELAQIARTTVRCDLSALPGWDELDPESVYLVWDVEVRGAPSRSAIDEIFDWVSVCSQITFEPVDAPGAGLEAPAPASAPSNVAPAPAPQSSPEPAPQAPPAPHAPAPRAAPSAVEPRARAAESTGLGESGSIRVATAKVDALIDMVGELVITQAMLGQLDDDLSPQRLEKLRDGLSLLERNTRQLQESVMRIRMLPIGFAFNRLTRAAHDVGERLGKRVDLRISGEQTEIDKTVLERIVDPLLHLVRNAIDHGLESTERRRAAGKSEIGVVRVDAQHQGGQVVIQIADDGGGIDCDKVLARARASGIVGEGQSLTDDEAADLIFRPGFSTAAEISDISGRGVGLDVVRENIRALQGTVSVRSVRGEGTTFTVRLPLTVSIIDAQVVRVGSETFIVPLTSIVESHQVEPRRMKVLPGGRPLYRVRDEHVPVVALRERFAIQGERDGSGLLVVVEAEGRRAGIVVDDLLAQQQVVIKSLEQNYRRTSGVLGASILGDGRVALILDVAGLIQSAGAAESRGWAA